jgi:tRNA wybutosine-synthesizing protein 4
MSDKQPQPTQQQLANQISRQRKKIDKDRRRKQYEDIQIQGTNNSSIVSKRSVEMLYTTQLNPDAGQWFQHFVKTPKRRSPAINRGYWIRMESIKRLIANIIDGTAATNPRNKICIVNLGCGFDPMPFQFISEFAKTRPELLEQIIFVDIDYPDLVKSKLEMIKKSDDILGLLGEVGEPLRDQGIIFSSQMYHLVGCNLRDSGLFNQQLSAINQDAATNIFVAEVSLAYMKPEHADPIIANASRYHNAHFIILEQILPAGLDHPFAAKMMYHFDHLRSPLGCVQTYPLIADQEKRFGKFFETVEAHDLWYNWIHLTTTDTKCRVSDIESFDEWEEFIFFCQHYVIVHATNEVDGSVYEDEGVVANLEVLAKDAELVATSSAAQFEKKFAAACALAGKVYINGGMGKTRENSTICMESNTEIVTVDCIAPPSPRMCHSLTSIGPYESLLIGGRSRPGQNFDDVYKFNSLKNNWLPAGRLSVALSRHSTAVLNQDEVLIFGREGFLVQNHARNTTRKLQQKGTKLSLTSCGFCYSGIDNEGFIVGGMISEQIPEVSNKLYRFSVDSDTILITEVAEHATFSRIGCRASHLDGKLVIVGGANTEHVLARDSCIVTFEISNAKMCHIPIDAMLIGHDVIAEHGQVTSVGGGGVCYSFGSYYSGTIAICSTS